jgi:hypothetical protein
MDVSDIIEYNASILNANNLSNSFFYLSKGDPTLGFAFDATILAGHAFPETPNDSLGKRCCDSHCGLWGVVATIYVFVPQKTRLNSRTPYSSALVRSVGYQTHSH